MVARVAWLNDIHLNFVDEGGLAEFVEFVRSQEPNSVVIGGDIGDAPSARCVRMALVTVFIVTVLALGELPCSVLVTPPGYITVGVRFFSLVHYGMYPDAAMLSLLSIGSVMLPCGGILLLMRRRLAD